MNGQRGGARGRTAGTHGERGHLLGVAAAVGATLLLSGLLKLHYQGADFDGLRWILTPTARLVEILSGAELEREAGRAYLCREIRFEIVPGCAGVNFLIAAFLSVMFALAPAVRSIGRAPLLLAVGAAAAYGVTVLANAIRITIAMRLHENAIRAGPITPERLFRLEGVTVFFLFLCALFLTARQVVERMHAPAR